MKICDVTQSYAQTGGGVRTYLHAKRRYVQSRTSSEHVLVVPGPRDDVTRSGRSTTYTIASPPVPGSPAYRLLLRSDKVLRILRREAPDLIESHCAYNLPWTAFRYARRAGCPVVGFYHTDFPAAYVQPTVERLAGARAAHAARGLAERYARALYRRFDATVAISAAMTARLATMGVPDVRHIPFGVDLDVFHPAQRDARLRRRFGAGPDDLLMVYAGRLDGERRPDLVLSAFEGLPPDSPHRLVLIGDGPLHASLAARAARDERVHVLHFETDRRRLAALLASADLYVSAMAYETFGLSVVEAQACGLAVLGVAAGAMVDRVGAGTGVLVPAGSADALRDAMLELTPAACRDFGRRARASVAARFSWNRTFHDVFGLYREVLSRRDAARDWSPFSRRGELRRGAG